MRLNGIFLGLLLMSSVALGAIEVYEFESTERRQRFETITTELRCPKCQNQSIAASNAPIAEDMRNRVYQRIRAGQSNEEIIGAMVERFGEFVHYRPPLNSATFLLWFGPALLGLVGFFVIFSIVRRSRRAVGPVLSTDERTRVDSLLRDGNDRDRT